MKTQVPCPRCLEGGVQKPCYFNEVRVRNEYCLEVKCKFCNFITWAKLPKEVDPNEL